jgi:hypothetical protein
MLNPAAPTIAPTVLAAYTPPTSRPGSWPRAAAASASGKLAPHRHAAGRTAHVHRMRSSWKTIHGLVDSDGSIGQNGSDRASTSAAHATAPARSAWQPASRIRGLTGPRPTNDPRLLPIPRPTRNTARMIENV